MEYLKTLWVNLRGGIILAKNKREEEKPGFTDFIGKKVKDFSRENGETIIHFTNGYKLSITGNVFLKRDSD